MNREKRSRRLTGVVTDKTRHLVWPLKAGVQEGKRKAKELRGPRTGEDSGPRFVQSLPAVCGWVRKAPRPCQPCGWVVCPTEVCPLQREDRRSSWLGKGDTGASGGIHTLPSGLQGLGRVVTASL